MRSERIYSKRYGYITKIQQVRWTYMLRIFNRRKAEGLRQIPNWYA